MDWLNLHASTLDSPEFVGSETAERGTWLSLLRYCIGQENGGTILCCKSWKDRQWQQLARVTLREVSSSSRLYWWDAECLNVWGYPKDKESEVIRKRETARLNGKTGGRPSISSSLGGEKEPTLVLSPKAEGEWKDKEKDKEKDNGMEGEVAVTATPTAAPPVKKSEKAPKLTDSEWVASLKSSPAYVGIDVEREHAKAAVWCENKRLPLSRSRFINWLNRAEKPITDVANSRSTSAEMAKRLGYQPGM